MGEPSTTERDRIEKLADSFMASYRAGQRPSVDAYVQQYPELADQLRGLIAALIVLERNAPRRNRLDALPAKHPSNGSAPREIGEFTIVREIGRGGMGVVYEAVQRSLGRHVALKVLSSSSLLNPTHLERFRLEARSAGRLHHSHIVPVFGVGESDGLHYYAMQFIPGQSLDQVIDALRKVRSWRGDKSAALVNEEYTESIVDGLLSGRIPADSPADRDDVGAVESPAKPADETRRAAGETSTTRKPTATGQFSSGSSGRPFYESVARVGLQVAEALAYAHVEGILHRDIKPSNLLLDANGNTWVTDFGLVKSEESQSLTETGDFVGTLRYMAPERLEGWSDRRSDIYGLGATLYELLTLRPFFDGANRAELIDDIRHAAPLAPTKIDPAVPRDLETIVLKAMAKEPGSRYHTAEEMAGDLRRFLADRPILARRSSTRERFVRWCRRNPAVATLAAAVGFTLLAGATVSTLLAIRATRAESDISVRQAVLVQRIDSALDEVDAQYRRENWVEAMAAVKRAEGLLAGGVQLPELSSRVSQWRTDLETINRLEQIVLANTDTPGGIDAAVDTEYEREFRSLGIDINALSVEEAADRVRKQRIRDQLYQAFDHWAYYRRRIADERRRPRDWWRRPLAVACLADSDEFRARVRAAIEQCDLDALAMFANSPELRRLPGSTLRVMAQELERDGHRRELARECLKSAHQDHPDDFWVNFAIASHLSRSGTRPIAKDIQSRRRQQENADAIPYWTAALALRPENRWVRIGLGQALAESGQLDESARIIRKAIDLWPEFGGGRVNLAIVRERQGRLEDAVAELRTAIKMSREKQTLAQAYGNLGHDLRRLGQPAEALAAHRKAVELAPDDPWSYVSLGFTLLSQRRFEEAVAAYHKAIELKPDYCEAHINLGIALQELDKFDEAVSAYRKAIELEPSFATTYIDLGNALLAQEKHKDAVEVLQTAIDLKPEKPILANAYGTLGIALRKLGRLDESIAAYRKSIELQPDLAAVHGNLGIALMDQRKYDDAIAAFHKVIKLQPDDAAAYVTLGAALASQNKVVEAIAAYQQAIDRQPNDPLTHNAAACLLATASESNVRDVPRAVALATRAVELAPQNGNYWNTLGVARYRASEWQGAVDALGKSIERRAGGDRSDWFFLAMAHWQLGHEEEARTWYNRAAGWMDKNQPTNDDHDRFRAEAEHVLGIIQPSSTEKDVPHTDAAPKPKAK